MHQQNIQGAAAMNKIETVRNGRETSETRYGMTIDWDVPITMDDGLVLRADVYRPIKQGNYPAFVSYGPYAKWLAFQDGYPTAWDIMVSEHPDGGGGTTKKIRGGEAWSRKNGVRTDMSVVASTAVARDVRRAISIRFHHAKPG